MLSRQLEQVYDAAFLDTAEGRDLDQLVALVGVERRTQLFAVRRGRVLPLDARRRATITIEAGTRVSTATCPASPSRPPRPARCAPGTLSVAVPVRAEVAGRRRDRRGRHAHRHPPPDPRHHRRDQPRADRVRRRGRDRRGPAPPRPARARRRRAAAPPGRSWARSPSVEGIREQDVRVVEDHVAFPGVVKVTVAADARRGPHPPGRRADRGASGRPASGSCTTSSSPAAAAARPPAPAAAPRTGPPPPPATVDRRVLARWASSAAVTPAERDPQRRREDRARGDGRGRPSTPSSTSLRRRRAGRLQPAGRRGHGGRRRARRRPRPASAARHARPAAARTSPRARRHPAPAGATDLDVTLRGRPSPSTSPWWSSGSGAAGDVDRRRVRARRDPHRRHAPAASPLPRHAERRPSTPPALLGALPDTDRYPVDQLSYTAEFVDEGLRILSPERRDRPRRPTRCCGCARSIVTEEEQTGRLSRRRRGPAHPQPLPPAPGRRTSPGKVIGALVDGARRPRSTCRRRRSADVRRSHRLADARTEIDLVRLGAAARAHRRTAWPSCGERWAAAADEGARARPAPAAGRTRRGSTWCATTAPRRCRGPHRRQRDGRRAARRHRRLPGVAVDRRRATATTGSGTWPRCDRPRCPLPARRCGPGRRGRSSRARGEPVPARRHRPVARRHGDRFRILRSGFEAAPVHA